MPKTKKSYIISLPVLIILIASFSVNSCKNNEAAKQRYIDRLKIEYASDIAKHVYNYCKIADEGLKKQLLQSMNDFELFVKNEGGIKVSKKQSTWKYSYPRQSE